MFCYMFTYDWEEAYKSRKMAWAKVKIASNRSTTCPAGAGGALGWNQTLMDYG